MGDFGRVVRMRPAPIPSELGSAFSFAAAREQGLSRRRLSRADLVAPFRGSRIVRAASTADDARDASRLDHLERCRAFATVAPLEFAFSHTSAAALYGMPLPERLLDRVHVMVGRESHPPRHRGVVAHRVTESDRRKLGPVPVASPETVWLQLASVLSLDDLIVAGDWLVRRKGPLSSVDSLHAVVAGNPGARGIRQLREALSNVRPGTDSPQETRLRLLIVRAGLPEPTVGYRVIEAGAFIGTPDLAWVDKRVAIEYEGSHHWTNRDVYEEDIHRRELFESVRWRVVLVTGRQMSRSASLIGRLREAYNGG
jgi:hypothetical protein